MKSIAEQGIYHRCDRFKNNKDFAKITIAIIFSIFLSVCTSSENEFWCLLCSVCEFANVMFECQSFNACITFTRNGKKYLQIRRERNHKRQEYLCVIMKEIRGGSEVFI